ncbi:alpha/beta hydrolase [Methylocystis parvus]|uniref:Alpha/beta hydrolase n=1 Tax=Methylocystis parvus TaxID=134 RepID=A0A6B8M5C7_9HYPH|nr:alpha/beta hydrolase [Methylocystis parvus]QGM96969.1 alpha/beta hydrolase [Methylocystis parvus]WBJ99143.1 alpha/beta hydrolase [Methylocystis parvus OBBP]
MSEEARALAHYLRTNVKPALAAARSPAEAAAILDRRPPDFPDAGGRPVTLGGVEGLWIAASGAPQATLLYLHGGAYFAGAPRLYGPVLRAFADARFDVFAPAYRLAPAHPFPAALDDARAAYAALRATARAPIVFSGDSAGGGLALAVMIAEREAGRALPRAAALFSPWTDLAATGASARENEEKDALFTRLMLRVGARAYLGGQNPKTPLASPLYADLSGLPPLLLHVGADEMLRDDSVRVVERARDAGVAAELKIWPDAPHGWQAMDACPEGEESRREAIAFLARMVASERAG